MGYIYSDHRPRIFTEEGQEMFLKIRDNAARLIKESGAVRLAELIRGVSGDTWVMLACVDRLVELKELCEVTDKTKVWGQSRIFVGVSK